MHISNNNATSNHPYESDGDFVTFQKYYLIYSMPNWAKLPQHLIETIFITYLSFFHRVETYHRDF